jgi:hypothetical protein
MRDDMERADVDARFRKVLGHNANAGRKQVDAGRLDLLGRRSIGAQMAGRQVVI